MKFPRLLLSLAFVLQYTIVNSQTIADNKNTSLPFQVDKYRQLFWDSLPKPVSWTNDYAWLFSTAQRKYLDNMIADYEKKTTIEIGIVTLDTFCTSKEKFDELALHIANTWGIGKKDKNNGILICIAPGYSRIRICNGYGIEKYLTDNETKQIIDQDILSQFKKGNYFDGTVDGLRAIMIKLGNEVKD